MSQQVVCSQLELIYVPSQLTSEFPLRRVGINEHPDPDREEGKHGTTETVPRSRDELEMKAAACRVVIVIKWISVYCNYRSLSVGISGFPTHV